ncbi:MarR family winged helix-turn-helix transcriptional regulator [Diaphorobacter caeni]|uniref:MarR family winged helix-turn-helix transcriptional regulator n=1 Tax=Diaphorobacter caeni TaxID=2784387 RepID=UPI00188F680E|nr:MarR family transcriptional regulator [Diaphorobacter caeni]
MDELRQKRRYGVGRMLLLARKDFVARLHSVMGDQLKDLPPAAGGMLPYIDLEGTRGTELARRMGVSKQAAGKAVRDLESTGLVTRVQDLSDARAFKVQFSTKGLEYMMKMHEAIDQIEADYARLLGQEKAQTLREALCEIAYRHPLP